jgi:cobalt/nickel transport system permease protein
MGLPEIELRARSPLHRLSPLLKLGVTLVLVMGTAVLPRRADLLYLWPAVLLLLLWCLARMPVAHAVRRLLVAECFILGLVLLSLFNPPSRPVVAAAVIKSNLCVLAMLLLTWTTSFYDLLQALRCLRLPSVMLTTLALMYRYLPVLNEESRRMQRARASRTFCPRRRFAWHNLTGVLGQLFIRTADRAERIYLAMCARGWK